MIAFSGRTNILNPKEYPRIGSFKITNKNTVFFDITRLLLCGFILQA